MTRQECPECYSVMKKRAEGEWVCPSCGIVVIDNNSPLWTGIEDEVDQSTIDYEFDGCATCENPTYPICKNSCPLFD